MDSWSQSNAKSAIVTLDIEGMSCGNCVRAVATALAKLPEVVVDSVAIGTAVISFATAPGAIQEGEERERRIASAIASLDDVGFVAKARSHQSDSN